MNVESYFQESCFPLIPQKVPNTHTKIALPRIVTRGRGSLEEEELVGYAARGKCVVSTTSGARGNIC